MEEQHEKLHEIYNKMQELHKSTDTEAVHCIADDLLIEALEVFGGKEYVKPLIESYNKLEKWYS
jgi:hypothetical protein